jgi:hypothetical protein
VPGFVHRRTHQVIHGSIDDSKILGAAMLQVVHFGEKHTCVTDDGSARLKHDGQWLAVVFLGAPAINARKKTCQIISNSHRFFLVVADTDTTTDVEMM